MKKIIILTLFLFTSINLFAQSVDLRRKIEVTGTAEQEVTPDVINISISLQEYMDGKKKITIDVLENQLESAVKAAGIPQDDFTVNNLSAWNDNYNKKKAPDFLASKQYLVRLHDLNKFDRIISQVDAKGIESTGIESYTYSKLSELKNQLQLKALLDAKTRAAFLVNGLGDKLGDVINIGISDNSDAVQPGRVMFKSLAVAGNAAPESDIAFKKIKLVFTADATFEVVK